MIHNQPGHAPQGYTGGQMNTLAPPKEPSLSDLANQIGELAERAMRHAAGIVARMEGSGSQASPEGKRPEMPLGGKMIDIIGALNLTNDLLARIEQKLF